MIEKRTIYICGDCGKIYEDDPQNCECESRLTKGKIIGPFEILDTSTNGSLKCQCQLCGIVCKVASSNIKRQVSCGCKPRSAEILQFMEEKIRYKCRKCGQTKIENLPIEEWCCEE